MASRISLAPVLPFKLDKHNLQLLAVLDKDGRIPLSGAAKKIGVSRENAHYRFRQLCNEGVIVGFKLLINYFALGYKCYNLLLNLENLGDTTRDNIVASLKKNKDIDVKTYILSNWDLELIIWVKNDTEFYSFYNDFMLRNKEYIMDKKLFVVTSMYTFSHEYLHESAHMVTLKTPSKLVSVDLIDEELLDILELNPREDLVSIAAKLKIAATTVAYRIKRLSKMKVILGCMPRLDLSRIGCTKYRIEVLLNNPAQRSAIITFLSDHAHVLRVYELIGSMDLAFEGDFGSALQVDLFLNQLMKKVPMIRNFDVRVIVKQ